MPDSSLPDDRRRGDERQVAPEVEAYEASDGVVLYDADNPLAWLKGSNALRIDDQV